jgi:mono/diheme cytochrome c family protein
MLASAQEFLSPEMRRRSKLVSRLFTRTIAAKRRLSMSIRASLALCTLTLFLSTILLAAQETKPKVQHVSVPAASAASGKAMFKAYCASCHGESGKGDGPAATALNKAPADLTMLAKKNGGKFPEDRVASILKGQATVTAHGNGEMPVWGPLLKQVSHGGNAELQQRVANLTRYLETLQAK